MPPKNIAFIVGARPHFMKLAAMLQAIRESNASRDAKVRPLVIHTGQHYDWNLSGSFFREFGLPRPDHHLHAGSGTHGKQTARMVVGVEKALSALAPDVVVVFGDTNSTLAGALAAKKLKFPVAHIEAGVRSFDRSVPEEINRVVTDQLSDRLFCPTPSSLANCRREGLGSRAVFVGDVTYDWFLENGRKAVPDDGVAAKPPFYLATLHRAETVDDGGRLRSIIAALGRLGRPVVLPLHPRTLRALRAGGIRLAPNIVATMPLRYAAISAILSRAEAVITDSSGLQREAFYARVPCVVVRERHEWPETAERGWTVVAGWKEKAVLAAVHGMRTRPPKATRRRCFGDGKAARRIVADLLRR